MHACDLHPSTPSVSPLIEALENRVLFSGDAFEADNTAATARTIATNGVAQTHSIHVKTDVDWVKFKLTETTPVVIETSAKTTDDTAMWLYGPNYSTNFLESDDNGGGYKWAKITRSLRAGTYWVKITSKNKATTIASYKIKVTGAISVAPYYPLVMDSQWRYTGKIGGSTATIDKSIGATTTLHGTTAFRVATTTTIGGGSSTTYEYLSNSAGVATQGSYYVQQGDTIQITWPAPLVTMPARVGIGGTYSFSGTSTATVIDGPNKGKYKTTTTSGTTKILGFETITTPAGTFTCLKFQLTYTGGSTTTIWLAKDIGTVQWSADGGTLMKLKSFS